MFKTIFNILLVLAICFTISMMPLNTALFDSPIIGRDDPSDIYATSEYEVIIEQNGDFSSANTQVEFIIKGILNKDFSDEYVRLDFISDGETVKTFKASDFEMQREASTEDDFSMLHYTLNANKKTTGLEYGPYSIRIYVEDETAISMDEAFSDILYIPQGTFAPAFSLVEQTGTINFRLYYPDNRYMYLVPVTRTVPYQEGMVRYLVNTLSEGPKQSMGLTEGSPIPYIPYIWISEKVATISLPAGDLGVYDDGSSASLFAAESITQTLRENLGIEEVQVLVNRQPAETALHGMDISKPWTTDRGPVAYICLETETGKLVLSPARLEADSYKDAIEQMFKAFKKGVVNETKSPNTIAFLPSDVDVLDYRISNKIITVDLSKDISKLYGERTDLAHLSIEALMNSLTSLIDVDKVVLTANGSPIQFEDYDFSEPLSKPAFINPER